MEAKPPTKRGAWWAKPPSLGSNSPHPKPPVPKGALLGGKKGVVHMGQNFQFQTKIKFKFVRNTSKITRKCSFQCQFLGGPFCKNLPNGGDR